MALAPALKTMGLKQSLHDPCLFSGHFILPHGTAPADTSEIYFCIYVDDFVFSSSDPKVAQQFMTELRKHIIVDIMGDVDFFLGTAFTWHQHTNGHLSVHLCQTAFTDYASQRFAIHKMN